MILRAQECRERATEARKLAHETKRPATKAALVQAADYWSALAERLEQCEQVLRLSRPVQTLAVSMPVFGYLVGVGIALFLGLLAASAQFKITSPGRGSSVDGSDQCGAALD